jgi:DNA-binding CsgD family transcriptional regulator
MSLADDWPAIAAANAARQAQASQRRARVLALWDRGLAVADIAKRAGVAQTTVYYYLRRAGKATGTRWARHVAQVSQLPRRPYWELHHHGGRETRNPAVLGRKFCAGCGRWRHLCDFPPDTRRGGRISEIRSRCETCVALGARYYQQHLSPAQQEARRERQRFWKHKQRRDAGIPEVTYQRASVVDRVEWRYLDPTQLVEAIERSGLSDLEIQHRAGVPARTIFRLRTVESTHVRLDVADKVAVALDLPLALIYGDAPLLTTNRVTL